MTATEILVQLSEQSSELMNVFRGSSRNVIIIFSFTMQPKNLKTILRLSWNF
jgi:hypothetical protein